MSNLYHIVSFFPHLDKEEMYKELEELATKIVKSGKLRIDADHRINFIKFSLPYKNVNMMFSYRELTDPSLLIATRKIIANSYRTRDHNKLNEQVQLEINRLKQGLKKYHPVSEELEMKLARIIVQSAHPVVISLLILENVEIFVSYSHNIGDLLDMQSWQANGNNSGMQSTNGRQVAIFISTGGDPFAKTEPDTIYGNGIPALARMMVIGGQEIGHYSDIMRDIMGRQVSRHSADLIGGRAKENVRIARLADIEHLNNIRNNLHAIGLLKLFELERHLKFFIKNKRRFGLIVIYTRVKILWLRSKLIRLSNKTRSLRFIRVVNHEKYLASMLVVLLDDMSFNLAPQADVYKSEDKNEEEAIACIEALARVPQQTIKWGNYLNKLLWPNLYNIYYHQVIPACITTYEIITNKKYIALSRKKNGNILTSIKKIWKKKPKYYRIWDY